MSFHGYQGPGTGSPDFFAGFIRKIRAWDQSIRFKLIPANPGTRARTGLIFAVTLLPKKRYPVKAVPGNVCSRKEQEFTYGGDRSGIPLSPDLTQSNPGPY